MTWETATIVGGLGVSFYLLYLKTLLTDRHELVKIMLMLTSWTTVLLMLSQIHTIVLNEPLANAAIQTLAQTYYQLFVWVSIAWYAYWSLWIFYIYGYEKLWKKV